MKNNKNKNANKLERFLALLFAGALMSPAGMALFQSCRGDDPVPPPQPPVNTVDTVKYLNQTDLNWVSDASTTANQQYKYVDASFASGARLSVGAGDMDKITQLLNLLNLGAAKVRFAANGAALLPTAKINLTDAQCDALVALWNKGVQFVIGPSGAFWITAAQSAKFTDDMLRSLLFSDARPVNIASAAEMAQKCADAYAYAEQGQRVLVQIGPFKMDADSLAYLRQMWKDGKGIHPNIQALFVSGTSAEVTRHPTEPSVLNSLYGMGGAPIDVIVDKNSKAPGGLNATCVNDTTCALMETLTTKSLGGKAPGTFIANMVGQNGQPVNPIVATYTSYDKYILPMEGSTSVDGVPMIPLDISKICAGIYDNEDGSYYILAASYLEVNNDNLTAVDARTLLFSWNAIETVRLSMSKDPQYAKKVTRLGQEIIGLHIEVRDYLFHYGQGVQGNMFVRPTDKTPADKVQVQLEPGVYIVEANDDRNADGVSEYSEFDFGGGTQADMLAHAAKVMFRETLWPVPGASYTFWPVDFLGTTVPDGTLRLGKDVIPLNNGTRANAASQSQANAAPQKGTTYLTPGAIGAAYYKAHHLMTAAERRNAVQQLTAAHR